MQSEPDGVELCISASLIAERPICWWGPWILNEEAFRIVEPHLNMDYFEVAEIDL